MKQSGNAQALTALPCPSWPLARRLPGALHTNLPAATLRIHRLIIMYIAVSSGKLTVQL